MSCVMMFSLFISISGQTTSSITKASKWRILKSDGSLWAWGIQNSSTFPNNFSDPNQPTTYTPIEMMTGIEDYEHLTKTSYVVKDDKTLWGWGENYNDDSTNGELCILGDGSKARKETPVLIANSVLKFRCYNGSHKALIRTDKSLWLWGSNRMGQIGKGSSGKDTYQLSPIKVLDNVDDCQLGAWHTVALKADGSVWVWGNYHGCGTQSNVTSPMKKMTNGKSVAAGAYSTYVIKTDNSLWAWGYNEDGEVGNGATSSTQTPVKIMNDVERISVSQSQCAAIKTDGSLWRWGRVGNGVDGSHWTSPTRVCDNVRQVLVLNTGVRVLKKDGSLWTAGSSYLGDGTDNKGMELRKILDDVDVILSEYYVRKTDGSLWAWGSMIGDGTNNTRLAPRKVMDGIPSGIIAVAMSRENGNTIYSLSGQLLAAPKKGINIVGGRKVVVR